MRYPLAMAAPDLDAMKVERLRAILRRLVNERFGDQSSAAQEMGISQTMISDSLSSKRGIGAKVMRAMAPYAANEMAEALGMTEHVSVELRTSSRIPSDLEQLQAALEMGKARWAPETMAYGRSLATWWRVDKPLGVWIDHLEEFDRAHRDKS